MSDGKDSDDWGGKGLPGVCQQIIYIDFLPESTSLMAHMKASFCQCPSYSPSTSSSRHPSPPRSSPRAPVRDAMKIISWNVASLPALKGFIEHEKGSMRQFLDDLNVDIMCFQETKLTLAQVTKKQASFLVPDGGWFTYWSIGQIPGYCGIATFCKAEPAAVYTDVELLEEENEEGFEISKEGRVLLTDHGDFVLFNVYCPNAGGEGRPRLEFKRRFLEALWKKMEEWRVQRRRRVVLVGDLNLVADMKEDMHMEFWKEEGLDERTRHWFPRVLEGGRYVDTFRVLHPRETDTYSFFDNYITTRRGANEGYRIDYILLSSTPEETMPKITKAEVLGSGVLRSNKASDHMPVMVELEFGSKGGKEEGMEGEEGGGKPQEHEQEHTQEQQHQHQHQLQKCGEEQPRAFSSVLPVQVSPLLCDVKAKVEGRVLFRKLLPDPNQQSIKGFFAAKKTTVTTTTTENGVNMEATGAGAGGRGGRGGRGGGGGGGGGDGSAVQPPPGTAAAAAAAAAGRKGEAAGGVVKRRAEVRVEAETGKDRKKAREATATEGKGLRKFLTSASTSSCSIRTSIHTSSSSSSKNKEV